MPGVFACENLQVLKKDSWQNEFFHSVDPIGVCRTFPLSAAGCLLLAAHYVLAVWCDAFRCESQPILSDSSSAVDVVPATKYLLKHSTRTFDMKVKTKVKAGVIMWDD